MVSSFSAGCFSTWDMFVFRPFCQRAVRIGTDKNILIQMPCWAGCRNILSSKGWNERIFVQNLQKKFAQAFLPGAVIITGWVMLSRGAVALPCQSFNLGACCVERWFSISLVFPFILETITLQTMQLEVLSSFSGKWSHALDSSFLSAMTPPCCKFPSM